ncbi:hypothetical protein CXB51_024309 [Gossypium anomalum]|uniref:Integrase catalytic domain-containing protein n=1 Tax=Gossypium anomalum TaxID=47600 RepID=A0A8J6CS31_9ROSI|nr:hypothetical protein CXB51_024309 [Gossypium anomalum]
MAPSSPSVQPATPMASAVSDGVDSRLFSTKKINILLDDHNYLLWRQQVLLAIKTYRLQHYIDPNTVPPFPIILDDAGVSQTNPEFDRFEQQDSALASWLLSSVSPSVLPHLIGLNTSSQIWNALVGVYGSKSTSQLMFYRRALHSQRKADLSIREFLMKVKSFCDRLAGCGEIISEQEHVTAILNGLPADYESVVTIITASPVPYSVQGVTTMLLDAEARQQLTQLTMMDSPSSANTVSNAPAVSTSNSPPSYRPNSNSRGRGRGRFSSSRWHFVTLDVISYNGCTSACTLRLALLVTPDTVADNTWYPDSGATHHLTNSPDVLSDSSSYPGPGKVYVGNGMALAVKSTGQSSFRTQSRALFMRSLLFVPGLTKNLLSVSKFAKDNHVMFEFFPSQCQVRDLRTREVLLQGSVHDGLYKLSLPGSSKIVAPSDSALCYNTVASAPLSLWHSRLGHPCTDTLIKALRHCNLVVADVWGSAPVSSNGFRYYVTFTYAHSRYTWLYFLHTKSEVLTVFSIFHKQAERSFGCQLLALQTDGDGEFQAFKSYLAHHGIRQRITCPYSSEQNGLVERKHRQIVEKGLSMLAHASMPLSCWTDAFGCAVYLINRLPSSPLGSLSPYEKLFHVKPNYSFLRVFGCLCFPSLRSFNSHKLQFRSSPCIFLGYSSSHHGYRCQDKYGRIFISRHVMFHESTFPFKDFNSPAQSPVATSCSSTKLLVLPSTTPPVLSSVVSSSQVDTSNSPPLTASFNARQSASPTPITNSSPINSLSQPTHPLSAPLNSHAMVTRSKAGIFKPKVFLTKAPSLSSDTPADIHEAIVVGCKWLFKVKRKADGKVDRYKARLVAKGFSQARLVAKVFLSMLASTFVIHSAQWFEQLPFGLFLLLLSSKGASKADTSLFVRVSSDHIVLLMVYVDDIVITGSSTGEIDRVVHQLHTNQKKYILEILHKTGMTGATATPTPMVTTPKLTTSDSSPHFTDVHLYRSTVGMLQYLCITRPELSFCVNKLSQYMNLPNETHWRAVKRVLRYLVGTVDYGLCFSKGQPEVVCYSDADWASSMEDRRSTTGYVVYLGPNPVAWCSRKQPVVSRSSSEAEYRSLANSENPTHHARIKHVEIDHHFVREKVLDGTLQVNFVPSAEQVADVLTKPIAPKQFESFRQALRVLKQDNVLSCSNEKETERMLE